MREFFKILAKGEWAIYLRLSGKRPIIRIEIESLGGSESYHYFKNQTSSPYFSKVGRVYTGEE